ncbi:MAG: AAA family ATPase, partial [Clostridia bacterium]|nr:AAA family ATPase [Clostridia bacterium]
MKIREIAINDFAGLHGIVLAPSDGVSVITGKNESGKSRICGFIRFMLYGVQKKEDINRILSFGGSSCSGSMTVSTGDGLFRIEREASFAERGGRLSCTRHRCIVTDLATGREIDTDKTPGELFLGVPLHIYASTAYINQIDGSRTGDGELSEAAANMVFSADENTSAAKAIEKLDEVRIALYHKDRRGGRIAEESAKIEELKARLISMEAQSKEIISLTGTCEELRAKKANSDKRLADLNEFFSKYERWQIKNTVSELESTLAESKALKKQAEKVREDISKDGFFPDAAYVSSLRTVSVGAERAMLAAIDAENEEKSAAAAKEKLSDRAAFLEKLNEKGGYAAIKGRHDKLRSGRKRAAVATLIFSAAAFAAALLAVLGFVGIIPFYPAVNVALISVAAVSAGAAAGGAA